MSPSPSTLFLKVDIMRVTRLIKSMLIILLVLIILFFILRYFWKKMAGVRRESKRERQIRALRALLEPRDEDKK